MGMLVIIGNREKRVEVVNEKKEEKSLGIEIRLEIGVNWEEGERSGLVGIRKGPVSAVDR